MENTKELSEKLFYEKKTVYQVRDEKAIDEAYNYSKDYMKYLDSSKTEREAVITTIKMVQAKGFREYKFGDSAAVGDKLYYNNRGKYLLLFKIGTEHINEGIRIAAAHIDAPRIDLKQCPLYEDSGMSFFKTHYYGGIRKYQWVATPLALHGTVVLANGSFVNIIIGEDQTDPLFYINDLLPHLGKEADKKPLGEAIEGEKLNILVGSRPLGNESNAIKLNVLKYLNDKYGIIEEDFLSAELSLVPAYKARDIGFDRSLIGAYGHDDRVCSYPSVTALLDNADNSPHTLMCILADKEETGSDGNTGMQSSVFTDLIRELATALGGNETIIRANSKCLSADVSAAYDPNFPEVFEKRNTPLLNCGVILTKFTGSRGKSGTNDASAEFIGFLRAIMAKDNIVWQTGELGKVDAGGGGTVAKYISKENIDVIDLGVPVISMHAPYEVISKVDLYETHRAISAFFKY